MVLIDFDFISNLYKYSEKILAWHQFDVLNDKEHIVFKVQRRYINIIIDHTDSLKPKITAKCLVFSRLCPEYCVLNYLTKKDFEYLKYYFETLNKSKHKDRVKDPIPLSVISILFR